MVKKIYIKEDTGSISKFMSAIEDKIDEFEDEDLYEESLTEGKNESDFISNKEKSMILDIFDKWDVIVLKDYMKDELYDGNLYHNFVVETDEMSETVLGDLERDLYALEELKDIGYEKNHNRNGINARTFYFYKFIN